MLRKDLQRLAVPYGLWLILLAASDYFTLSSPAAHLPGSYGGMWDLWKFLTFLLCWLTTIFIAAGIVLEDSPLGTEAFWLTRPFARGSVVGAKFTLLAALIMVPIAVTAGCLAHAGVGTGETVIACLSGLLRTGTIPLAAAAIATTAESLGKFALTTIFILIGCVMISTIAAGLFAYRWMSHGPGNSSYLLTNGMTLTASKTLAFQFFALIVCGGLIVWRYLQHHIRFFLGYVVVAALACPLIGIYWRWDFAGGAADHPSRLPVISGAHFSMTAEPSDVVGSPSPILGVITAVGPDRTKVLVPMDLTEAWFFWPNGDQAEVAKGTPFPSLGSLEQNAPQLLSQAIAPATILNLPPRRSARFPLAITSPVGRARLFREPAIFRAHVDAVAVECAEAGELPLKVGQRGIMAGQTTTLLDCKIDSGEAELTIRNGSLSGPLATVLGLYDEPNPGTRPVYLLVNRTRRQALIARDRAAATPGISEIGGYSMSTSLLTFESEVLDDSWNKDAVLVCLAFRRVGIAHGMVESAPLNLSQ
jgi:ABC-type transport system involved in multi-copper enzyme maturation permease subunit